MFINCHTKFPVFTILGVKFSIPKIFQSWGFFIFLPPLFIRRYLLVTSFWKHLKFSSEVGQLFSLTNNLGPSNHAAFVLICSASYSLVIRSAGFISVGTCLSFVLFLSINTKVDLERYNYTHKLFLTMLKPCIGVTTLNLKTY